MTNSQKVKYKTIGKMATRLTPMIISVAVYLFLIGLFSKYTLFKDQSNQNLKSFGIPCLLFVVMLVTGEIFGFEKVDKVMRYVKYALILAVLGLCNFTLAVIGCILILPKLQNQFFLTMYIFCTAVSIFFTRWLVGRFPRFFKWMLE